MKRQFHILVVDEQWSMRQAVAASLRDMGFREIFLAADALEAKRILQTERVAAVIADWNLSGMSGLELLHWVRGEQRFATLPFVLVTGKTDRERVRQAIEAGASEYLVRPYTVQDLANKVQRTLRLDWFDLPAAFAGDRVLGLVNAAGVEERLGGSTVLIVDDVPFNIAAISSLLKGEYTLATAESGIKALNIARSGQPPDLILLDVMMPGMDGYEVCRQLKADPATRDIPVIFLTSHDDAKEVVRGFEAGAVDYIAKPAEAGILKARIRTHLRLKTAFADLAHQYASLGASAKFREEVEQITRHDIDNPIAAILGAVDLLLSDSDPGSKEEKLAQLIQSEARRFFALADRSLSMYRMDAELPAMEMPARTSAGVEKLRAGGS